ncbi:MAG: helix-turn-helix domain-containing protein [Candidatus Omnitrophota bacterium]
MNEEKLLTVRDVATLLGVTEKDVLDLTESGVIPGYKIGGLYLRFKKEQVEQYQKNQQTLHPNKNKTESQDSSSKFSDFLYFNDFYILAAALIIVFGYLVYRGL